jgi:hypothetical protein
MNQDLYEMEMSKALDEIFNNLRQLKNSRSDSRKSSMGTAEKKENELFQRSEQVEPRPEKDTQTETQGIDVGQVRLQVHKRRQLPVLPQRKKS